MRFFRKSFVCMLAVGAALLLGAQAALAQENQQQSAQNPVRTVVSGTVTDTEGEPLPGAAVMLSGTKVGTTTDLNGQYTLKLPATMPEKPVLEFSFVGMDPQKVNYRGQAKVNVRLQGASSLEATVVTGYQTLKRRDIAGSFTALKAEDIMMPSATSIDQMLQGKVAGLVVTQTSSRVGSTPDLKIRGTSTIMGNTAPLWVVDGVIQPDPLQLDQSALMTEDLANILGNQISWLNPSDIENITILRDASATAIYGSKASNGVIVITTKQGRLGKTTVKYRGDVTVRERPRYGMFNLMNSQERMYFSEEVFQAGSSYKGTIPPYKQPYTFEGIFRMYQDKEISAEDYKKAYNFLETSNTDWFKLFCRTSVSQNHNLSISGGTDKMVYNASVSYGNNKGVERGNDADNMSARVRVGTNLASNVHLDVSIIGSINRIHGYGPGVNPLAYATQTSRAIPAFDQQGAPVFYRYPSTYQYGVLGLDLGYNMQNEMENTYSKSKMSRVNATMDLSWDIIPELTFQFTGGISDGNTSAETYAGEKSFYIANTYRGYDVNSKNTLDPEYHAALLPFGGELQSVSKNEFNYNFQAKFQFHKTIKQKHRLNAMLGMELRSTIYKTDQNTAWGYLPDRGNKLARPTYPEDFQSMNTSSLPSLGIFENIYRNAWSYHDTENNFMSFFATFSYTYDNRYVVNLSMRNDLSNRFGQDVNKRFDPLYSIAASWDITQEPFLKGKAKWLNQLRIRGSYGIQGNAIQSVSPDMILARGGVVPKYNQYGVSIRSLPNPLLSWESTNSWNVGLDLQIFKWFTITAEGYSRASDAIIYQNIGREYGMTTMALNGGRVTNRGVEATFNVTPIQKKNIVWTIGMNVSNNWNSTQMADSSVDQVSDFLYGASGKVLKVGYPVSGFWSYSFKGLDPETGYPTFNLMDKTTNDPSEFLVYSGQRDPSFTGGFNTSLKLWDFTVRADFVALLGGKKRLPNPFTTEDRLPQPYVNMSRTLLDRWKKPGDEKNTDIPAFYSGGANSYITLPNGHQENIYTMWAMSDARVVNASFFRCTQMSVAWNAPAKVTKAMHITDLMVSATMSNVFVIGSKAFDGFDPELGDSIQPKMFSFGLSIGF